jgi:hypothetical protein
MTDKDYWATFAAACMSSSHAYVRTEAFALADRMLNELKIRFPDPAPSKPLQWIDWEGGECAVDPTAEVCVQLRDGSFLQRMAMNIEWGWDDDLHRGDVIGYMVLKP